MYINYNPVAGVSISEFYSQNAIMGTVSEVVEAMAGRDEVISCPLAGALEALRDLSGTPDIMYSRIELLSLVEQHELGITIPLPSVRTVYAVGTYNGVGVEVIDSPYPGVSFALLNVDAGALIFTCLSAATASAIIEKHGLRVTTVGTTAATAGH